ncbi:haloacid dehalogenase-like hydrolase [Candidatus Vidania fulgoroideae]|nr:haloacid dehalogenase-like hydrolase [Candidatus Vidania fulgoroideae]
MQKLTQTQIKTLKNIKAYNKAHMYKPNRLISIFDLDKTITKVDCEGLFYKIAFKKNLIPRAILNKFKQFHNDYNKGQFNAALHFKFQNTVIAKYKLKTKHHFINFFVKKYIKKNIYTYIAQQLKKKQLAIISTSSNKLMATAVNKILLKTKNIIYSSQHNKYKGLKEINHGINKVYNIKIWIKQHNITNYITEFYTDSENDYPLLKAANKRYIINPNKKLLSKSKQLENRTILILK